MKNKNDNPLNIIFIKDSSGKLTEEIESTKNIHFFFEFLKEDKINADSKIKILDELKNKIHVNRYISDYFSSYDNKSIYIFLFELYINKNTNDKLKSSIKSFIEELCLTIKTGKEIYEYLFQKLARIYRGEAPATSNSVKDYLNLLSSLLCETEIIKPKNYFSCTGEDSKFQIDMKDKRSVEVSYSFTININFKLSICPDDKNITKNKVSNLIKLFFSNKKELSIDLKYPCFLIVKELRNDPIKILSNTEWINLNITTVNIDSKLNLFINVSGENNPTPFKLTSLSLKFDDKIEHIEFFKNFYGEVSSIYMFSQKDSGPPGVNSTAFLSELKNYREGLWKKKITDNFFQMIKQIYSVDSKSKSIYFKATKVGTKEDKKKTLYDNLVFVFTPINYYATKPDIVEDAFGRYKLQIIGNIKNHQFENYQKKLIYVSGLNNFFPIAEMFLIYPETLNEENLELFLNIISNVLNFRKQNLKNIKQYKYFNVLSMFIEKYPQKIFTQKILNAFYNLAKTLFINNYETICYNYFKHILLNEKILSKYSINLQIEFWNQLYLFCQSDKTQIEAIININRLCLILRFYDRNKYTEMCCEEHLNMIKDEYKGSKKIMNPTMTQKLSNLKNIMDLIIESQEPKNAVSLFKLLTLDLSPCLIKFILNIFINAFEKIKNENWKDKFVEQLLQAKYEVIVANTFLHSLPDIRISLLKFVYQVHLKLISSKNTNNFNIFEKMIKTCLLPDKMFYCKSSKFHKTTNYNSDIKNINANMSSFPLYKKIEPQKKSEPKKEEPKKPEPKKPEPKKIEPKKEEPKKMEIKKIIPPKIEDNPRPPTAAGGKQNFLSLLSKFDKPKNTNEQKKPVIQKQIEKKDNPFIKTFNNSSVAPSKPKPIDISKKSFLQVREEILKKAEKKEEKPEIQKVIKKKKKEEKPSIHKSIKEEKKEIKYISTSNSSNINKFGINTNTVKTNYLSHSTNIFEKNSNNNISQLKPINNNNISSTSSNLPNSVNNTINNKNILNLDYFSKINNEGEEIIIKDSEIDNYIKKLYSTFLLWSMRKNIDSDIDKIDLDKSNIKVPNVIEIIFLLNNIIKNKELIIKFLKIINKLVENPENCFELFFAKKVYASFLAITFENYRKKGKDEEEIFKLGKSIIVNLFINSLIYCEKQPNLNPGNEIETLLLWGTKTLQEEMTKEKKNLMFEFIQELFFEFLIQIKVQFEIKLKFDTKTSSNFNIEKNYIFKNYLMFITEMYIFIFRFKHEPEIHKKGTSFLYPTGQKILLPELVSSMRMNDPYTNEIAKDWLDFPLIYDIFSRYKFIWVKNNVYKKLNIDKYKKNKSDKYNYIIENIILDKENKNNFQKELSLLCYEDKKGDFEYIIPLIQIILKTIMFILEKLKNIKNERNEKDFIYWLKDLKDFLRFIIIASSNLLKSNDSYKQIQDKCIEPIAAGLCFLYNLLLTTSICKTKIEKNLNSLLLLCFKLIKCQYNYENRHKKIIKLIKKGTNDLGNSAVIILFNEYVKDKSGNPFLSLSKLESMPLEDNNKCLSCINSLVSNKEFINAFFENQNLKKKLYDGIYSLYSYKKTVDYRYDFISYLLETYDDSYKKTILTLLPKYENELAKYSNNSLEKNIKNKNMYKVFKKRAFSWRGYWSSRENFFSETPPQFKYKLINHYTKSFMKPILVPILDISYYLPEFSGFDPKNLFKKENNTKSKYIVNLDIDKTLKPHEQSSQDNTKEKGKFGNVENYLGGIYKKSNIVLYEKYLKIANNLEFGKEEEFAYIQREKSNKKGSNKEEKIDKKYYLCCLVKASHHIKGVCFIDDKQLNFKVFLNQKTGSAMSGVEVGFTTNDDDYDQERKTCFGSYFVCHPKDKDLYNISINYKEIKWIFRRRYYYTNSAFEIYTTTNKTFYFNLKYEKNREIVVEEILKKLGDYVQIVDDLKETNSSKENIVGYENGIIQKNKKDKIKLSKKLKSWKNWEITNFEMLMWLNIFGNRSYNDISQYPVFPWILSNYKDPLQVEQNLKRANTNMFLDNMDLLNKISGRTATVTNALYEDEDEYDIDYQYRDMNLPMGMMELNDEGMKRKELFLETYETLNADPDENMKPYIFGSNYSNPVYVCNYLMRLFPFTHISIELQGKKFDDPNRLFLSVDNSFFNSITQKTDVRELIPEFFYLPEMFRNINKLNMGKLESGEEVNDVKTPCNDNPYDFIMTMKSVLESNKLSKNIQNWIDLVFGYKSRGKEAENANNIFTEASYQEIIDITKVENKESYLRMVEFGLIPTQVMNKECPKRDKKEMICKGKEITDSNCDLKYITCKLFSENDSIKVTKKLTVLQMVCFSQDKITFLLNNNKIVEKKITFSTFDKSYHYEYSNIIPLKKYTDKMSQFFYPHKFNSKVFHFCQKSKILFLGGFYDGKVQIFPLDQKIMPIQILPFSDKLPILSVCVDKDEEFAFFGNSIGNIRVLKLDKEPNKYIFYQTITDHMSAISHIDCSSELNLWASASIDGYINIYTLPLSKLIRSIKVPTNKINYVFLSSSPLPSILVIAEEKDISEIFMYSINGKLLLRQKEQSIISCPIIINDLNKNDYISYIINDSVIIRSIPTLIRQVCVDNIPNLYAIYPSDDMKFLYATNKYGNEIYIIKDEPKNKKIKY